MCVPGIDNAITASLDAYTPVQITIAKGLVAGTVNTVIGLALDRMPALRCMLVALAIGAVGHDVSITMWIPGARLVGAARGQAIFALAPFIGSVLSEHPVWMATSSARLVRRWATDAV